MYILDKTIHSHVHAQTWAMSSARSPDVLQNLDWGPLSYFNSSIRAHKKPHDYRNPRSKYVEPNKWRFNFLTDWAGKKWWKTRAKSSIEDLQPKTWSPKTKKIQWGRPRQNEETCGLWDSSPMKEHKPRKIWWNLWHFTWITRPGKYVKSSPNCGRPVGLEGECWKMKE